MTDQLTDNSTAISKAINFETSPQHYRRLSLKIEGRIARLDLNIPEDAGLRPGYELKLNSYDLGVDIELADAIFRLRFEHPEVRCVVLSSALDSCFCAGANIMMLRSSTHAFKVNFCKYTNETRLALEDATAHSDQTYIAAVNGVCSGGGYELALACDEIYLIDDRKSTVSLPEVPFLGVLPGTGGLTRLVDKRGIRPDHADIFCTVAEGLKGKRAKEWKLVDGLFPSSRFAEGIDQRAKEIANKKQDNDAVKTGITLAALTKKTSADSLSYQHVTVDLNTALRTAELTINAPTSIAALPLEGAMPADWYPLQMLRELDDALCHLRFNHPEIGLVLLKTRGDSAQVLKMDTLINDAAISGNWFANEVLLLMKRVFKRLDMTAKSFYALIDEGSCFVGSLLELALAADRAYMLEAEGNTIGLSILNDGALPMGNGLTRLQTRFLADDAHIQKVLHTIGQQLSSAEAEELGIITLAMDDIDWDDEIRLVCEERVSLSPDSLTGMEASLRFAGPETLETKIFGRLTAWQNWIFQRPNAVGPQGALTSYGEPTSAKFDFNRT